MALITAEKGPEFEEKRFDELQEIITGLADTLKLADDMIQQGELDVVKDVNKYLTEVRGAYLKAVEMEARIHAERKRKAGVSGGYALDLGAARSEIGCRLDRLRRCCEDRRVS